MRLLVRGVGVVSSLGNGRDEILAALSGQPFQGPFAFREGGLEKFMDKRAVRRHDRFARAALLSAFLAAEDAGIRLEGADAGVIFGSGHGPAETTFSFLDSFIDGGDSLASPISFAPSVHNAVPSVISQVLGRPGPMTAFGSFENSVANVLSTAEMWLEDGVCGLALAVCGDEVSRLISQGVSDILQSSGAGPLPPGEACVTLLLEKAGARPCGVSLDVAALGCDFGGMREALGKAGASHVVFSHFSETRRDFGDDADAVFKEFLSSDYSSLSGCFPTSPAFDLGVSSTLLGRDSFLHLPGEGLVGGAESVAVVDYAGFSGFNVYILERARE